MSKIKVPLILFSGGLDSTYLLYQALRNGPVDVLYVPGPQGPIKEEAERRAREKIIKYLEAKSLHKVREQITAPPIDTCPTKDFFLRQPLAWIVSALMMAEAEAHSEVQIGYILGDQALAFRQEMLQAWNGLSAVTKMNHVPLAFPLLRKLKEQIYRELPGEVQDALWHCETPIVNWPNGWPTGEEQVKPGSEYANAEFEPCGRCTACKAARNTKESLHLIEVTVMPDPRVEDIKKFDAIQAPTAVPSEVDSSKKVKRADTGISNKVKIRVPTAKKTTRRISTK